MIWGSDETDREGKWVSFVKFLDLIAPFLLTLPLFVSVFLSRFIIIEPKLLDVSGYLCNENNPLDIIDLCPQLPSNSQLFNTVPAPLLPEVVQREKRKV